MYRLPISFHRRLYRGEIPITYIVVETHLGLRAYAGKELSGTFGMGGYLADGTYLADGSVTAGSSASDVISKDGRLVNPGYFERALYPKKDDVLTAFGSKQLQHAFYGLDNTDKMLSALIAKEPFIGRPVAQYVGFEADPWSEHLKIFEGIITEIDAMPQFTIEAEER